MKWDQESRCLEHGRWLLQPIEEWSQFWQPCNWYTFHPFMLELEDDRALGAVEVTFIVLGLGLRWRWNHTETERMTEIKQQVADLEAGLIETHPVNRR